MVSSRNHRRGRFRIGWSSFLLDGRRWLVGTTVICCVLLVALVSQTNQEIRTASPIRGDGPPSTAQKRFRSFEESLPATDRVSPNGFGPDVPSADGGDSRNGHLSVVPERPSNDDRRLPVEAASLTGNAVFANRPVTLDVAEFDMGESTSGPASLMGTIEAFSE